MDSSPDTPVRSIEELADSFVQRLRAGERPSIESYKADYPDLADQIDDVFPALEMLEQVEPMPGPKLALDDSIPSELGEYELIRLVGRGGMGVVFEAQHSTMLRRVALKILPRSQTSKPTHLARFQREARSAGQLHHSNIVPVFEVGQDKGYHFYAMQFIHGENLALVVEEVKRLRRDADQRTEPDRRLPSTLSHSIAVSVLEGPPKEELVDPPTLVAGSAVQREAAEFSHSLFATQQVASESSQREAYFRRIAAMGVQVAEALEYAHRNGVLHRDIKPGNLILDTAGTVWVTDFGLAKREDDDLTVTGDIVGTLRYMAPERFEGKADARSDIYSLGLTLYELCTLRHAFENVDQATFLRQVSTDSIVRPRRIDAGIPLDLETIILEAVNSNPQRRYSSAQRLADDLRAFLEDRPIGARRISLWERFARVCRRNPLVATLSGCVLLLLLLLTAGSVWHAYRSNRETERSRQAEAEALRANARARLKAYELHRKTALALRRSGGPGQHLEALRSLDEAVELLPTLGFDAERSRRETTQLRTAAIASMILPELVEERGWDLDPKWAHKGAFDTSDRLLAQSDKQGNILVRSLVGKGKDRIIRTGIGLAVWKLEFSPDGRYLASKHHPPGEEMNASLFVWDLEHPTEPILKIDETNANYTSFAFGLDRPWFGHATFRSGVDVYSLEDGSKIANVPSDFRHSAKLQFGREGRLAVASLYSNRLEIWSLDSQPKLEHRAQIDDSISSLAWDVDRSTIVVGTRRGAVYVWRGSIDTKPQRHHPHHNLIDRICFGPSGKTLVSSSWDQTIRVVDLTTGRQQLVLEDDVQLLSKGSASDGRFGFRRSDRVGTWKFTESPLVVLGNDRITNSVSRVRFHTTNSRLLARSTNSRVEFWDTIRSERVGSLPFHRSLQLEFTADGKQLVVGGVGGVMRWPIELDQRPDGRLVVQVSPAVRLWEGECRAFTLTRDGREVIVLDAKALVRLQFEDGTRIKDYGPRPTITKITATHDDRWFIVSGRQGISVLDARNGTLVKRLAPTWTFGFVALHPKRNLVGVAHRNETRFWSIGDWELVRRTPNVVRGTPPFRFRFDSTGRLLVKHLSKDELQFVDPQTDKTLAVLPSSQGERIFSFDLSPDGRYLAVARQRNLHLFDLDRVRAKLRDLGLDW